MRRKERKAYQELTAKIREFLLGQEELVYEHSADAVAGMVAFDLELTGKQEEDCNGIVCDWYYDVKDEADAKRRAIRQQTKNLFA